MEGLGLMKYSDANHSNRMTLKSIFFFHSTCKFYISQIWVATTDLIANDFFRSSQLLFLKSGPSLNPSTECLAIHCYLHLER